MPAADGEHKGPSSTLTVSPWLNCFHDKRCSIWMAEALESSKNTKPRLVSRARGTVAGINRLSWTNNTAR